MMESIKNLDQKFSERLRLKPESSLWGVASFLAHSGDSWFWMAALVLVWFLSRDAWHNRVALVGVAIVTLALTVFAVKLIFRRPRPKGEWGEIYRRTDPLSFPSGHAARATLLAVLAMGICPLWLGILILIWAPLVSIARVLMGVHYLSDVLGGIALGIAAGFFFLQMQPLVQVIFPFLFLPLV